MVKVIYEKGKKYLNIDGRQYGPHSLYFHIQRSIATLEYFTENGQWDEKRQKVVKSYIEKCLKAYTENYE